MQSDWLSIVSIVASIVSVALGAFAIWLAAMFYRWSHESSKQIEESAAKIAAAVERLETLFGSLYEGTFSLMRDTVTDMRKHMWSPAEATIDAEVEARTQSQIDSLRQDLRSEVDQLLANQQSTGTELRRITGTIDSIMNRAITESRRIEDEAREMSLREKILSTVQSYSNMGRPPSLATLMSILGRDAATRAEIAREIDSLMQEGRLEQSQRGLSTFSPILKPPGRRAT